jgi:hypothetical protein
MPSKNIIIVEADEKDKMIARKANYQSWGRPLTVEQYLQRENELENTTFCRGSFKTWVLKSPDNDEILASCQTYIRKVVFLPSKEEKQCFSIGHVYVEDKFRGNHYAQLLVTLLRERMRQNGIGISTLYSDVGKKFYNNKTTKNLDWTPTMSFKADFPVIENNGHSFSYLTESIIAKFLKTEIDKVLKKKYDKPSLYFYPTLENFKWFWKRTEVLSKFLLSPPYYDYPLGIFRGDEFMVYFFDICYHYDSPKILFALYDGTSGSLDKFIEAARIDAYLYGMDKFVIWNAKGVCKEELLEEIPSLAIDGVENVNWIFNEKYLWV